MGEVTGISWTDKTWSPWHGCDEVNFPLPDSPSACADCYAKRGAKRNPKTLGQWGDVDEGGTRVVSKSWHLPEQWNLKAKLTGKMVSVFPSIMDPFDDYPGLPHASFFKLCEETPWLRWLLLTKRPQNIKKQAPWSWFDAPAFPWPRNVWLGATMETRACWDYRRPFLVDNGAVHFASVEPQLEDLGKVDLTGLHWVIQGCESGHHVRPFDLDWCRRMRDQCADAGVAYFLKQIPNADDPRHPITDVALFPADLRVQQFPEVRS